MLKNKKNVQIVIFASIFIEEIASNICLPALSNINHYFNIGNNLSNLILSSYLLGLAISRPIYGIISDSFGRKNTTIYGIAIFFIGSLLVNISNNLELILLFRFFQGFGAGVAVVIGFAVLCDIYTAEQRAKIISMLNLIIVLAPISAPIIGAQIIKYTDSWRYVFLFITLSSFGLFIAILKYMEETLEKEHFTHINFNNIISSYKYLFKNHKFMLVALLQAIIITSTWLWIAGIRILYLDVLRLTEEQYSFYNMFTIIFYLIGSFINHFLIQRKININALVKLGFYILIGDTIIMIIASDYITNRPAIIQMLNGIASISIALILPNATSLAMQELSVQKGNGSALIGTMQMVGAAISAYVIGLLNPSSIKEICTPILLTTSVALILFIMFKKTKNIPKLYNN